MAFVEKTVAEVVAKLPSVEQKAEAVAAKVYAFGKAEFVKVAAKVAKLASGAFVAGGAGAYVIPAVLKLLGF